MKIIIKCTDGIMTGKEWRFNGSGQITLGREKGSMVTTAPEDNSISRHQCVIDVVPPNVYVSDAGSTHGTYVNGQLAPIDLSASVENLLLEADELGLGAVWLGIASLRDRMDKVREVISIPEELEAFAIIPCGYPIQIKNQQNRYEKERVHFVG